MVRVVRMADLGAHIAIRADGLQQVHNISKVHVSRLRSHLTCKTPPNRRLVELRLSAKPRRRKDAPRLMRFTRRRKGAKPGLRRFRTRTAAFIAIFAPLRETKMHFAASRLCGFAL